MLNESGEGNILSLRAVQFRSDLVCGQYCPPSPTISSRDCARSSGCKRSLTPVRTLETNCLTMQQFKKHLKAHLFKKTYLGYISV